MMKKVKNTELKKTGGSMEKVKEGKIKKVNPKVVKKLKDVTKLVGQKLAPKIEQTNKKNPTEKKILKVKNQNEKSSPDAVPKKTEEVGIKKIVKKKATILAKKQQKPKKPIETGNTDSANKSNGVEKAKPKILAKKQQKPKKPIETDNTDSANKSNGVEKAKPKILPKKQQKPKKPIETDNTDSANKSNGVEKAKQANKAVGKASTKVLAKKNKKANERQLIKEGKLAEKKTHDPAVDAATVFVGNLPANTNRLDLINLFKDYAPVKKVRLVSAGGKILYKHIQRKNAGSINAYVVLQDKETAENAVSLHGTELQGHHLRITLATKKPEHHEDEGKRTVFVGNLKYTATEENLHEIFSSCGEIDYVRCLRDGDKGCKGVAYVCFKTSDSVGLAVELNETILDERPIRVERYSVKKLGAKAAREAEAEKEKTLKKGAKQRIDAKKTNKVKPVQKTINSKTEDKEDKKSKKSEFRGVKVEALKKKKQLKKKKSNNQMLKLAKKIAPKLKAE